MLSTETNQNFKLMVLQNRMASLKGLTVAFSTFVHPFLLRRGRIADRHIIGWLFSHSFSHSLPNYFEIV